VTESENIEEHGVRSHLLQERKEKMRMWGIGYVVMTCHLTLFLACF